MRPIDACSRCANELDLHQWHDGKTYCANCLICPHDSWPLVTCVLCMRERHTVQDVPGPRILDIELYLLEAVVEYDLRPWELLTWTYDEQHQLACMAADMPDRRVHVPPTVMPPHLRQR